MSPSEIRMAGIGAGNAGMGHLLRFERLIPGCVVAFCDPDRTRFDEIVDLYIKGGDTTTAGDLRSQAFALRPDFPNLPHYTDASEMIRQQRVNVVVIASPDHCHAENVRACVKAGVHILLEKPIATTKEDVEAVYALLKDYDRVVAVNFSLRGSSVAESARKHIQSGIIGDVVSVQWINHVPYGDVYFRCWMRTRRKIGSLLLQKATHDLDLINYFLNREPTSVFATGSRRVYGGPMPKDLVCDECEKSRDCYMSLSRRNTDAGKPFPPRNQRLCVFSSEIDIDDNHQVLIQYNDGISASYAQTFCAPAAGARRGGTFVGTEGILDFQFYDPMTPTSSRSRLSITRWNDRPDTIRQEIYDTAGLGHFGSSESLAEGFLDLLAGRPSEKNANIRAGYISALTCLAAQESCRTSELQRIH